MICSTMTIEKAIFSAGEPPPPRVPSSAQEDVELPTTKGRILIVEDEYLVATAAEEALTSAGYVVVGSAATAAEAIEKAVSQSPDLIVMDVKLAAGSSGIDAAKEIFARTRIRCIFATAHVDVATRALANTADPLNWLPKPYAGSDLVRAVGVAMGILKG
jgi:two-component system, response regulator PdtaR